MKIFIFVKTMLYITTKIQHKVGFFNAQKIVGFKSVSSEVYFWRENLDEISPSQLRLATVQCSALIQQIEHITRLLFLCNLSKVLFITAAVIFLAKLHQIKLIFLAFFDFLSVKAISTICSKRFFFDAN